MHKIQGPFILIYFSWLYEHFRLKEKKSAGHLMWWDVQPRDLLIWKALQPEPVFSVFLCTFYAVECVHCACIWSGAFTRLNLFWISDEVHLCGNESHCVQAAQSTKWKNIGLKLIHTHTLGAFSSHPEACSTRFHKKTATGDRRPSYYSVHFDFIGRRCMCMWLSTDGDDGCRKWLAMLIESTICFSFAFDALF